MPPPIHIVNPLWNAAGGSEWRAIQLWRDLSPHHQTLLWSENEVAPEFRGIVDIQRAEAEAPYGPRGGTLIIVGTYFPLGDWLEHAAPQRVVVIHNVVKPALLERTLARLRTVNLQAELVFTSELTKLSVAQAGRVQYPPIDLQRFKPRPQRLPGPFVVGRMSRDVAEKHHPDDPVLYQQLLDRGIHIHLMGADSVAAQLPVDPGLKRLPAGAIDPVTFLHGLDCFVYRTAPQWSEPFGRVIAEAMACGLPVVAERNGGYCEIIQAGESGLLFSGSAEALGQLLELQANPGRATEIGRCARQVVETLYDPAFQAHWRAYFSR